MYHRYERFSIAISDISRNLHKLTGSEMEKHGLKSAHGIYLLTLARYGEGLTAPQLCEICCKDKSDVSRMMKILEDKGIVKKDGAYQNRYAGVFRLTEQGAVIAQQLRTRASKAVEIAGADLTEEQRETFYAALESVACRMQALSQEGLPEA